MEISQEWRLGGGSNDVNAEMDERIDLTIDSLGAACAMLVGVASAVGMQLKRTPQGR